MRCLTIFLSLALLLAGPASALVVPFSTLGPPSGFRQDFRLDFSGNSVESASATLFGARTDFTYFDFEGLTTDVIEFDDSCTAPGTCVAFASAGLTIGSDSVRIRMTTPRGFYFCEPLGSFEGSCGRSFDTPQIFAEVVVSGPGNGSFTLTASPLTAIPEPATWLGLIAGLGLVGTLARNQRRVSPNGAARRTGCRAAA